jgi:FkbM family methyltransferase
MTFVSYAQNFEDIMLWRALKHVESGFYIDVGANDPTLYSVTRAFYDRGWRGINVEPVKHFFDRLVMERPRDTNLNVAVGEASGIKPFFDVAHSGLATSDATVAAMHRAAGWDVDTSKANVVTLSEICRAHASADVHFLKVDVEGSERDVLVGMNFKQYRPWIVVVEATVPMSRRTSHETWEGLVTGAGYKFVYFDGLNRYYVAAEHEQLADAFLVPPNVFDDFVLHTDQAHLRANEAGARAHRSQVRAQAAETKAQASEANALAAEARVIAAEDTVRAAEAATEIANARVRVIEAHAEAASIQARAAEAKAEAAEAKVMLAESHVRELEAITHAAEKRAHVAATEARGAEAKAEAAEAKARSADCEILQLRKHLRAVWSKAESAEREAYSLQENLQAMSTELAVLRQALVETERMLAEIHASFSVRVTAPMRYLASLFRGSPERHREGQRSGMAVKLNEVSLSQRMVLLAKNVTCVTGMLRKRYSFARRSAAGQPNGGAAQRATEHDCGQVSSERHQAPGRIEASSKMQVSRVSASFLVCDDRKIDVGRLVAAINDHIERVE